MPSDHLQVKKLMFGKMSGFSLHSCCVCSNQTPKTKAQIIHIYICPIKFSLNEVTFVFQLFVVYVGVPHRENLHLKDNTTFSLRFSILSRCFRPFNYFVRRNILYHAMYILQMSECSFLLWSAFLKTHFAV